MMNNTDDFFEVNCEVPFKPIKQITIENVRLHENQLLIRAQMILANESDSQFIQLIRTEKDVQWLIDNIANSGHCPLRVQTDPSDHLTNLLSLVSTPQPLKVKKIKALKQKIIERCLKLITTVILQHLKRVGEDYETPIFIFFHQNFLLYQNPIYYKENKSSLSNKVGNFFWQKYVQITGKVNGWQELQAAKNLILQEKNRLYSVSSKLFDYITQLCKLQEEFISQKQKIKKRVTKTQQLHLNFEMQLRYLDLTLEEIKETAARAEDKRYEAQSLITAYTQTLRQEAVQAGKASKKLLSDYVKVMCDEEQKIRIGPL